MWLEQRCPNQDRAALTLANWHRPPLVLRANPRDRAAALLARAARMMAATTRTPRLLLWFDGRFLFRYAHRAFL